MHTLSTFWEIFFPFILGLAGISSLLAIASPQAFAAVARFSGRCAIPTGTAAPSRGNRQFSIDHYVLEHTRFFGCLVGASAIYLWFLYSRGPDAYPQTPNMIIMGVSLAMGLLALVQIDVQKKQIVSHMSEALADPLTGLGNRRAFDAELSRRIAQCHRQRKPLSLLILDIDRFKAVNDTYGHQTGDAILKRVAEVLADTARHMDVTARIGGEEFAIILPESDIAEASAAAERQRLAIEERTFTFDGKDLHITTSIGLASAQPDDDPLSLVKQADAALYAAKEAGRNRCYRQGEPEPALPTPCT
jgi:diguanylate cyclase (GGDEF)-like protein